MTETWQKIVASPEEDLLSTPSTAPSRVRSYLFQPQLKSLPYSCALVDYDNDLFNLLYLIY